ncbi:hypothetical protein [Mesorhizobium sp. B1-1-5]|uniref:hypothetical protein n=1 Tax=Mesorhizobium sp. B1-1-5 TaxID=2589979 RepID=UPI001FEE835E|nr:hypothetical protein [Mesorhizobium sp. B1-1-5]
MARHQPRHRQHELSVAGAYFEDAQRRLLHVLPHQRCHDPGLEHQCIDANEIATGRNRTGIVSREAVKEFWLQMPDVYVGHAMDRKSRLQPAIRQIEFGRTFMAARCPSRNPHLNPTRIAKKVDPFMRDRRLISQFANEKYRHRAIKCSMQAFTLGTLLLQFADLL